MHPKALQYLPKQWPLHPVIGTFEIWEAGVQLLAICLCSVSKMLQGKDIVECRQSWPEARLSVRMKIIALCKVYEPSIQNVRVKAHDGFSDSNGPVFIGANMIALLEDGGHQATIHLTGDEAHLKSCI